VTAGQPDYLTRRQRLSRDTVHKIILVGERTNQLPVASVIRTIMQSSIVLLTLQC
jgi:hypothetical protein